VILYQLLTGEKPFGRLLRRDAEHRAPP
jgi:hypothetical protein